MVGGDTLRALPAGAGGVGLCCLRGHSEGATCVFYLFF